jgi:hypothetical protein
MSKAYHTSVKEVSFKIRVLSTTARSLLSCCVTSVSKPSYPLLGSVYWIQLDAEVMRVRTWFLGKLKGIAPISIAGSFDTSHHVALGVRMSSRGTVFIEDFVKNLPSGWEV